MFRITKDGAALAMTEAPTYVRRHENGCFVLCAEAEAEGVAHAGVVYHLLGRPEMEGVETAALERVDAGAEIKDAQTAIDDLVVASLGTDTTIGEMQAAIDDLVIAALEGGATSV
jgi:hypothetical protein